ncbi:MAG: PAS domain-containing protein [Oxalobacteraceae bacterium]|nr:MAG: PAS domain-containing protein [Oxalobacteraceae bacterium]
MFCALLFFLTRRNMLQSRICFCIFGLFKPSAELDNASYPMTDTKQTESSAPLLPSGDKVAIDSLGAQDYQTFVDTLPEIIWIADSAGRSVYYNNYWYDYTGIDPQDDMRATAWNAIHPDDHAPARDACRIRVRRVAFADPHAGTAQPIPEADIKAIVASILFAMPLVVTGGAQPAPPNGPDHMNRGKTSRPI